MSRRALEVSQHGNKRQMTATSHFGGNPQMLMTQPYSSRGVSPPASPPQSAAWSVLCASDQLRTAAVAACGFLDSVIHACKVRVRSPPSPLLREPREAS